MKNKLFIIFLFIFYLGWSQSKSSDELEKIEKFKIAEKKSQAWVNRQYEWNVVTEAGKTSFNEEAQKILSDDNYYNFIYPKIYTWTWTSILLEKKVIKQAIWYMINLYGMDKKSNTPHIMKIIISLDQALDMEKVLLSSYYSYISFDREIVSIENNKVKEFLRPDIAEKKLNHVKELTTLLMQYRKSKQN